MKLDREALERARVITLGLGEQAVGHGIFEGAPCIVFVPQDIPGEPGKSTTIENPESRIGSDTTILRFVSMDAALRHLDRMKMMMEDFERRIRSLAAAETKEAGE